MMPLDRKVKELLEKPLIDYTEYDLQRLNFNSFLLKNKLVVEGLDNFNQLLAIHHQGQRKVA